MKCGTLAETVPLIYGSELSLGLPGHDRVVRAAVLGAGSEVALTLHSQVAMCRRVLLLFQLFWLSD